MLLAVSIWLLRPMSSSSNPGWPLCNFLAFICSRWNLEKVHLLCYHENRDFADLGLSLVAEALMSVSQGWKDSLHIPNAVGWELNRGKKLLRCISLAKSMDPTSVIKGVPRRAPRPKSHPGLRFAPCSVPGQATSISAPRRAPRPKSRSGPRLAPCSVLGLATVTRRPWHLGAPIAFNNTVRKITLLDSGRVAMSNLLRQSLYTLGDCLNGGEFKATAAVRSLEKIFPAVEAEGVVMAISMPGHPVPSHEENIVLEDCKHLHNLIDCHDAVFLLTDTRESRWLPTLLCANANKITVTAALGFDSSLVMCHGAGPLRSTYDFKADVKLLRDTENRLGRYFCNDVVAPIDSTANRSLDQQCTVTWPGFAPIASALAVELLVGILHHPHGLYAKAEFANSTHNESTEQPLGILPHQIRGSLSQFSQMTLIGHSSKTCSACCCTVVSEYWERGMDFVLQAINHPTYLEDLTGLTELMKSASSFELDWDDEMDDNDNNDDDCVEI
ncbi:hypothetical protein ACSBR2_014489 [Camellia fascicularis]